MTALNKQALREAAQEEIMLRSVSDTSDSWQDEASPEAVLALLDELESKQTFQQAFFRQSLMYDVVAEAYEEAKEQIAKDVEIKARLCIESNSLFDRLRAAEKRIAEHNFENRLLANADRDIKALRERIAELEAVREVFLRAKALMYQSGGAPIENSLNPIDAWLYDAELIAAGIGVKGD